MNVIFYHKKKILLIDSVDDYKALTNSTFVLLHKKFKKNIIKTLENKKIKKIYLYHPNKSKLVKIFEKIFPVVEAAGGIVKNTKTNNILFIFRNNKWDLPKGKLEKKEGKKSAAIREVQEETGLDNVKIVKKASKSYHIFHHHNRYKLKKTYWYLMETESTIELIPQQEENIELSVWKKTNEIPELLNNSYKNIKMLLQKKKINKFVN